MICLNYMFTSFVIFPIMKVQISSVYWRILLIFQELRFSQQCLGRLKFSEMMPCHFLNSYLATWSHISEDWNLHCTFFGEVTFKVWWSHFILATLMSARKVWIADYFRHITSVLFGTVLNWHNASHKYSFLLKITFLFSGCRFLFIKYISMYTWYSHNQKTVFLNGCKCWPKESIWQGN